MPDLHIHVTPEELFESILYRLEAYGDLRFIPSGMSMYPFIAGGHDSVRLRTQLPIHKSDIVAAHIPGRGYVLHRVYSLSGNRITLMGDGNLQQTETCSLDDVIGVVTHINNKSCHSPAFRLVSALWMRLRFMRRLLLWCMKKTDSRL